MSRYIDITTINPRVYESSEVELGDLAYDYDEIQAMPFLDIVRCKDCRWATETKFKSIEGDLIYLKTCPSRTEVIDDDDYCSYGERADHE